MFLRKKIGNYSILESLGIAVLLGVAFWISSQLYSVRQDEYVVEKNKTTKEMAIDEVAGN